MLNTRRFLGAAVLAALLFLLIAPAGAEAPRNVILMIGDGMGFQQIKAASYYAAGKSGQLAFEKHYRGEVTTHSLDSHLTKKHATDSAAAATAMATGHKTKNGTVSQTPDGDDLGTVLERFKQMGRWTGLVTTVPITHATPAALGAHAKSRDDYKTIARDYLTKTRPNVLFGAYHKNGTGVTREKAAAAGYTVVTNRDELDAYVAKLKETGEDEAPAEIRVSGQFAAAMLPWEYADPISVKRVLKFANKTKATYETAPHLSEMTRASLEVLARSPKGFFLMIEGGSIDWACHDNVIQWAVFEVIEFERAYRAVTEWAGQRDDTLVIVTADHECGGLWVVKNQGKGKMPEVFWGSREHTGMNVPVFAWGVGAKRLEGVIDNTDFLGVMTGAAAPARAAQPVAATN